jgi:hypothetical protein
MIAGVFDIFSSESLRISLELTLSIFAGFTGFLHSAATHFVEKIILDILLNFNWFIEFFDKMSCSTMEKTRETREDRQRQF